MSRNIQDYVIDKIIEKLEDLNKLKTENQKLRYLASQVDYCSNCYDHLDDYVSYLECKTCEKKACTSCQTGWYRYDVPNYMRKDSFCNRTCLENFFQCDISTVLYLTKIE